MTLPGGAAWNVTGDSAAVQKLSDGLDRLDGAASGHVVAQAIRRRGTTVRFGQTPVAHFDPPGNEIVISEGMKSGSVRGYIPFQSSQSPIPCAFLYPAGWQVREITEKGSIEIFIAGPNNRAGTYSPSLSVDVTRAADQTPIEAAAALLARFRSAFSVQERGPISTMVDGMSAAEVEFTYTMPLPLNSINPQWTVIKERRIFFKRQDQLYELDYAAPEEDYETWLPALHTLVESFAFAEKPVYRPIYRPAATAAVPQYVHDAKSPEYQAEGSQSDEQREINSHKEENHD